MLKEQNKLEQNLLIWSNVLNYCWLRHRRALGYVKIAKIVKIQQHWARFAKTWLVCQHITDMLCKNSVSALLMTCSGLITAGLHGHHIPPPTMDWWALGVWRQQEPEPWRAASWAPLGPRHVYCGLQEILPPWHHCGEQADPHLPQRDCPLRTKVG